MGRSPCCENMGVKKGPWTPEEDQVLISHIKKYGHGNWRAIPRQAGLFRCGKSCRLRWSNYLKPGIKRGNFTKEEEETIISLHAVLGSRWSTIAAKLPGRTDNEIKNLWHSHLKKRFESDQCLKVSDQKRSQVNEKAVKESKQEKKHRERDHVLPACSSSTTGISSHSEASGENYDAGNGHGIVNHHGVDKARASTNRRELF